MITHIKGNLFDAPDDYQLAHCISADAKMGAGIAVQFVKHYPYLTNLRIGDKLPVGICIHVGRVLNLITKQNYWDKPTIITMNKALWDMKLYCDRHGITKIAMPRIGSGLDKLPWYQVEELLKLIFKDYDILVYTL
jgi:hypothetical protein